MTKVDGSGASFSGKSTGRFLHAARSFSGAALLLLTATQCGQGKVEPIGPAANGGSPGIVGAGSGGSFGPGVGGQSGDDGLCTEDVGKGGVLMPLPPGFGTSVPTFANMGPAETPPPPISGGTLIVLRDGVTVVASDPDRDLVYVADVTDLGAPKLRFAVALGAHDEPGRLIEDGAGKVHVALRNRATLVTIDPATGTVGLRRSVCLMPRGLAYDQATDRIHLACANGQLQTFSPTGATPERTLTLDSDLRDVVVDGERLLVSRFRSAQVLVVERDGRMGTRISLPPFTSDQIRGGTQFDPSVAWRMVGKHGGGATMVHQRGMHGKVDRRPGGYGGPSCDGIVHTSVSVVKSDASMSTGAAMPGFVLPVDVAVSPDGTQVAMVAAGNGHVDGTSHRLFVSGMDDVTAEWKGCGNDGKHGPAARPCSATGAGGSSGTKPVLLALDDTSGTGEATGTGGAGTGGAGTGGAGTGGVTGAGGRGTRTTMPVPPPGPACSDLPGNVEPTAVAFLNNSTVVVQSREPAQLWIVPQVDPTTGTAPAIASVSLSDVARADLGHAVFHSNSGGGLACASCHPEGHEDGRVWNFSCEGDRRTQDIGGGLAGSEPFHWSGDLGNFAALVNTVFVGRMSGPALSSDQAKAMMGWIDSVPTLPALHNPAEAQVARGKAIFNDPVVACASCHNGTLLTNNQSVFVGTGAMFQVPALRGLAWRAPYMHNGCAPDLQSRFTSAQCGGGDAHGKTSQLTDAQRADLIAYLQSL